MTTGVAVYAQEPVREHAAAEERAKLLLDEARSGLLSACGAREEVYESLANDLVKERLLRFMAWVLGHEIPDRDRVGQSTAEEARADRTAWRWAIRRSPGASCRAARRAMPGEPSKQRGSGNLRMLGHGGRAWSHPGTIWSQSNESVASAIAKQARTTGGQKTIGTPEGFAGEPCSPSAARPISSAGGPTGTSCMA